ncbi:MAG: baseplate J/gp47 family protein [Draconibacterium sp.]
MANCGKDILIAREGTKQQQRYIDALKPDSVKLNDFGLKEWMQFAYNFAKHLNYFDVSDSVYPKGTWKEFFKSEAQLEEFLKQTEVSNNITPHLALYVSFVKLLDLSKNRFNKLTKRHLDFYYSEILNIQKLPATADKAHLIFELAKNAVDERISEGTKADGGKDATGKKLNYETTEELIANKIKVSQLKSIYVDHTNNKIKAADAANSYDGIGADFPDGEAKWWPFGYFEETSGGAQSKAPEYPELPNAKLGFALSSEILELQEGERNLMLTVEFSSGLNNITAQTLHENMEVYCTGEKGWLGPFKILPEIQIGDGTTFSSGQGAGNKKLSFVFQVPKEEKAIVRYYSKIHGESYNTLLPVCRFLIKTENQAGVALYRELIEKDIKDLTVKVNVKDVKSLLLESDFGVLNAAKPFYPFGTQPVKKSNFYINYPEMFKKNWDDFTVDIEWKNTPEASSDGTVEAFENLYFAYRKDYQYQASSNVFLGGMFNIVDFEAKIEETLTTKNILSNIIYSGINQSPSNLIVTGNEYFKADVEIQDKEEWVDALTNIPLFEIDGDGFKLNFKIDNINYEPDKNGPARISLNQSFLHELFPRIYALAFSSEEDDTLIPNEPYTPLVEKITLDYNATSHILLDRTEEKYKKNDVVLFHEHPFGQSEEHPYLKEKTGFLFPAAKPTDTIPAWLIPMYCKGGELYIGLENVKQLQSVALLIQVLEGSENPLAESFTGKQKVEWSVLAQNEWKSLDSNFIISNETDNFLKSGIVKIAMPRETTQDNTRLPSGLVWLKAKIHKNYDVVCKVLDVLSQAVLAEFSNNGNELSHLENGLPAGSISKLVVRVPTVKGISQPFNTFGGKPVESDAAYYRRVSERLRHKNRAITIWDYENLILQEFPEIHKVKCLNHTKTETKNGIKTTRYLSPGNVLIVVIPDIANKNVFDIYQPRVSKAKLNAIQDFVNQLNTFHVNAVVVNPDYEEIMVELNAKFYKGFDENFYTKVLKSDITKLLSPWAFDQSLSIDFGVSLYKSVLINYVENLEYVDFIENVKLFKRLAGATDFTEEKMAVPSSPLSILVSAKDHDVKTNINECKTNSEIPETCQK